MFSTDKNIETIAQLIEVVRHYIGLQSKYMKLDVIDKIVRLFTALECHGCRVDEEAQVESSVD